MDVDMTCACPCLYVYWYWIYYYLCVFFFQVRRESTKVDDAVFVVGDSSSSDSPLRFRFNVDDQFTTGTDAPAVDGIFAINDVEQWRHIAVTFDGKQHKNTTHTHTKHTWHHITTQVLNRTMNEITIDDTM